jgi:hypothetical protein
MPAAPATFPGLSWKYNRIVLRRGIPKPLQGILGRKMFRTVMPQSGAVRLTRHRLPAWTACKPR